MGTVADTWILEVEVGRVVPAVFASARLPVDCKMAGLVCMRSFAVAWEVVEDVEGQQD